MSLLNTFAILFETDAKEAKEDIEQLSDVLEETEGSAKGAGAGLDDVSDAADNNSFAIGGLTKSLAGLAIAYVSFEAIATGVMENALAIDKIGKFSQVLGENIVDIDAWGEAVARNGGSADAFRGSVESLNTRLADIKITGGGEIVKTLAMMGVNATTAGGQVKSAFDVLPQLADSFQRMSASQSFSFGRKLGLDQGTILLLQQGRNAVDELVERQKMLGGVTEEGYKTAALFNDQWDDTKRMFNSLWMTGNSTILPVLTDILKSLENMVLWMRENKDLIEGFFAAIGGAALAYSVSMVAATVSIKGLVAAIQGLKVATGIGLVIAAMALLYEDVKKWADGGDSLIGDMLGPFTEFKEQMLQIFEDIKAGWKSFTDFFDETGKSIGGFLFDTFGGGDDQANQSNEIAKKMVYSYSANPMNHAGAGGGSYMNKYINNNVTVGGASIDARGMTADQASNVVNNSLTGSIKGAMGQMDTGVDR